MICYRDRTYCSCKCGNNDCGRNIATINQEHFTAVGLPLAVADFKCKEFKEADKK